MPPVKAYAAGTLNEYSFGSGSRPPARAGKWCRCLYFTRCRVGKQCPPGAKKRRFSAFFAKFLPGRPPIEAGQARASPGEAGGKRPGRGTEHLPGRESFSQVPPAEIRPGLADKQRQGGHTHRQHPPLLHGQNIGLLHSDHLTFFLAVFPPAKKEGTESQSGEGPCSGFASVF